MDPVEPHSVPYLNNMTEDGNGHGELDIEDLSDRDVPVPSIEQGN